MERLREQVEVLQREAKRDKELLRHKDEELHRQRGPSPVHSHSQEEERVVDDRNKKKKTSYPHGECERSHRERTTSPPHRRSGKEEQDQERYKGPVTQRPIGLCKLVLEPTRPTSADIATLLVGPTN